MSFVWRRSLLVPAVFHIFPAVFHLFYKTAYGKLLIWRRKHGFIVKNKETLIHSWLSYNFLDDSELFS